MARSNQPAVHTRETIAAIATATGGGIGIVRASGPLATPILAQLVRPWPKNAPSHKLHYGAVIHPVSGERVDEVLAVLMRAPRSYTGEDVAELHGHGGPLVLARLLDAVLHAGARMAQPGEFTRRAFEAGRIDLTRAEAVAALIGARSERALKAAQQINAGALAREVHGLRARLVAELAELEGALDFPDDVDDAAPAARSRAELAGLGAAMTRLAGTYRAHLERSPEVALVGRVNVGKSSLFNALCGEERAIVDAAPGTTRDVVQAELRLDGVPVLLYDTAGERAGAERVEQRGLELGRARRGRADLVVLVVDSTDGFGAEERALWDSLGEVPRLIAWNKRDLGPAPFGLPADARVVATSALYAVGLDELRAAISSVVADDRSEEGTQVMSQRQAEALRDGAAAIGQAVAALDAGEPAELAAVEARGALNALGRVTGETVDADVLDAIFARFCIGK